MSPAFIATPIFPNRPQNAAGNRRPPYMATVTTSPRRSKPAQLQDPAAQGPHCPLIDQTLLKHCLLCARALRLPRASKQDSVNKLLHQARKAIGISQRGHAERFFLRALVLDPGYARTYFLYALQVQRRDPLLARELFKMGVTQDPNDAKLLQAWGLFESKQGKLARAQRLVRRSVDLEPANAPVLKWRRLFPR